MSLVNDMGSLFLVGESIDVDRGGIMPQNPAGLPGTTNHRAAAATR